MLILLSPSKALNFQQTTPEPSSEPLFGTQTQGLVDVMAQFDASQLGNMMKLSDKLSQLNHERFQNFGSQEQLQAFFAFTGDTYKDIPKDSYDDEDLLYAQEHLRILSGLYGALRPLDQIEPYRLEMGTRLETDAGKTLYDYWSDVVTKHIQTSLQATESQYLINLASNEYVKVVDHKSLSVPMVTPVFKDEKNGQYKVISFYAKRARGMMAHHLLKQRAKSLDDIITFQTAGYVYDEEASTPMAPVFMRPEGARS